MASCIQDDPAALNNGGWWRQNSCDVCLSAVFLRCGRERITERGTIECKVLVFFPTFLHRLHPTILPPPTSPARPPWGKTSRNLHQIRRCHIKNRVTEKAVMAGKDVAAVLSFSTGLGALLPCLLGLYAIRGSCTQARHVEVGFDLDGFVTVWNEG